MVEDTDKALILGLVTNSNFVLYLLWDLGVHLTRWLPKFAEKVQKNAQTEFYKKLARLTETFVQKDFDTQQSYPIGTG